MSITVFFCYHESQKAATLYLLRTERRLLETNKESVDRQFYSIYGCFQWRVSLIRTGYFLKGPNEVYSRVY